MAAAAQPNLVPNVPLKVKQERNYPRKSKEALQGANQPSKMQSCARERSARSSPQVIHVTELLRNAWRESNMP